jgi:hypothetical protein
MDPQNTQDTVTNDATNIVDATLENILIAQGITLGALFVGLVITNRRLKSLLGMAVPPVTIINSTRED